MQDLRGVVNETGSILEMDDSRCLGDFILSTLDDLTAGGRPPLATALVEELEETFPGFRDSVLYDGRTVKFARKAQSLVADLHHRCAPACVVVLHISWV